MRKAATVGAVLMLVASAVAGLALAKGKRPKPTIVEAGSMVLEINGDLTPRVLPRHRPAPMGFWGSGRLSTKDGSHPPALESASFDADKDVFVGVKGLPACRVGKLEARSTRAAEAACGAAIIGHGSATVEVAFPEQPPFESTGPLVLFNGGERNGVVTVLAHAYVNVPAPTAVVATARFSRVNKGSLGLHGEVDVPRIAGGSGSVVAAELTVRRVYSYKGTRLSVISGRCPDGRFQARGTFEYSDGTKLSAAVVRPCRAKD